MTFPSAYRQFVRPWLIAAAALAPKRSILTPTRESAMNILGIQITTVTATRRQRWTRRLIALGAANAVVLGGGIALAVWSTTGSGAGTAKAATLVAPTVTAGTAPAGQLYPGLTANGTTAGGDLVVTASNPNAFPITVTVSGGTFGGCTTTGVSIGSTASFPLAASAAAATVTMSKVLSMSTAASNDCQGATITATSLVTTSTTP